jgi:hypothetical protein
MPRGRPKGTEIRKNISWIIKKMGYSYGYEIYKNYIQIFGNVKMRTVYYNLKSGVNSGEFVIMDIRREVGDYTWGSETERIYYAIGPYARFNKLRNSEKQAIGILESNKLIDMKSTVFSQVERFSREINEFLSKRQNMEFIAAEKQKRKLLLKSGKLKQWCGEMIPQQSYLDILKKINEITFKI